MGSLVLALLYTAKWAVAESWEPQSTVITAVYASNHDRSEVVPAGYSAPARAATPVSDTGLEWVAAAPATRPSAQNDPLRELPRLATFAAPIESVAPRNLPQPVVPVAAYQWAAESASPTMTIPPEPLTATPPIGLPERGTPSPASNSHLESLPRTGAAISPTVDPREFALPTPDSALAQGSRLGETPCPESSDLKPIQDISYAITPPSGRFPQECELSRDDHAGRLWAPTTFTWTASALHHKPSYFEDVHLERYGHTWGPLLQPAMSGAHFFLTAPILPYKMGLQMPNECVYSLGYYRPGSCAPYMLDPLPISIRAGLMQAGAVTGVVYLIP